jgi:uncharacterized protein YbbC (DUF1343 family)
MKVLPGIDVLLRRYKRLLRERRIGVIANATSVTSDLRSTVDVLAAQADLQLRALFGPEHGLRGDVQDAITVGSGVDQTTGLPEYSLYGPDKQPTPVMLAGIDLLIYDIQDVGCRYYTYPYTLSHAMEAAAEHDVEVMVLDRPNPLNGRSIEGPVLEASLSSFVGRFPIPVRHGLTIGELAQYMNVEFGIACRLKVVPMEGWRRRFWFDDTGLPWVPPSPNIPTVDTATVYPGTCLIEGTNVSEGRGTAKPFEFIGAPWANGRELAGELNARDLPGVRFRPLSFTPVFSKHSGTLCHGVQLHVIDRTALRAFEAGLHLVAAFIKYHPNDFEFLSTSWEGEPAHFDLLSGVSSLREMLLARVPVDEIVRQWQQPSSAQRIALRAYLSRRKRYLRYA